jgi:hypothetical protein
MGKSATSRQDVLKQLWDSPGPSTLWQILEREPAARESGVSEEVRREAEDVYRFNSSAAEHLVLIAKEIERIRDNIDRFAAIETVSDLLDLYRSRPICHSSNFNRLLGVFWLDALRIGEPATIANMRRGMKLLSNIYVAVNLIKHAKEMDPKEWARTIQADAILDDLSFHQFLNERAHFLAKQGNPLAEGFAQMATYIRTCSRLAPGITRIDERNSGGKVDGPIRVHIPVSADQAESPRGRRGAEPPPLRSGIPVFRAQTLQGADSRDSESRQTRKGKGCVMRLQCGFGLAPCQIFA